MIHFQWIPRHLGSIQDLNIGDRSDMNLESNRGILGAWAVIIGMEAHSFRQDGKVVAHRKDVHQRRSEQQRLQPNVECNRFSSGERDRL